MNDSEVKTTQQFLLTHFIPKFLHIIFTYIIICKPMIFFKLGIWGWCLFFTLFSCLYRFFYRYFTLLMSDNVGVRLISLITMDFHKTSAFQWTLGPLGKRLSAFWLTLPCYSCWRNMWTAPHLLYLSLLLEFQGLGAQIGVNSTNMLYVKLFMMYAVGKLNAALNISHLYKQSES